MSVPQSGVSVGIFGRVRPKRKERKVMLDSC